VSHAVEGAAFEVGTSAVHWRSSRRLVPSRFPPVALFDRVADPADLEAVFAVEALTNSRVREAAGALAVVPAADRVSGPGAGFIMAPFVHRAPGGGRFSTAHIGAYYAAQSRETAIAETVYHRERFLRATRQSPMEVVMRELQATVRGTLLDLRGAAARWPTLYDPHDYGTSQAFTTAQVAGGAAGVVYDSVRHVGGVCVAVWRPRLVSSCRQGVHLTYVWNGARIEAVYERSGLRAL
jgi:hypothetical protein